MRKKHIKLLSILLAGAILVSNGVVFAEGAESPTTTVLPSDAAVLDGDMFKEIQVGNQTDARPLGTVINLFDYWLGADEETRFASDAVDFNDNIHKTIGINRHDERTNHQHTILFGRNIGGQSGNRNPINVYNWDGSTSGACPLFDIVDSTLLDGYPVLDRTQPYADWNKHKDTNGKGDGFHTSHENKWESLAYLFDPGEDNDGKKSFINVGNLLQTDANHYYYYDAQQNYAYFDETSNNFILYKAPAVYVRDDKDKWKGNPGQFFPFNAPNDVFTRNEDDTAVAKKISSINQNLHHYFGLTMTTRFVQKNGGVAYNGLPVTYNFSGDDDVWVFIDDVLVGDLGGKHDKTSLEINFQTGAVVIYEDKNGDNAFDGGTDTSFKQTTLAQLYEDAKQTNATEWSEKNPNTYADNSYHTLKFFYLERGNTDSNMSLKFNLVPIPENEITKRDQEGQPLAGVQFDLYPADREERTNDKGFYDYTIKPEYEGKPIWSGETDDKGHLRLLDKETNSPLEFKILSKTYGPYYVLRERVPDGYHRVSDVYLYYEDSGLLLSGNYWETGAYASPKVTATAPNVITPSGEGDPIWSAGGSEPFPTIVAVIFKRMDMSIPLTDTEKNASNWAPVSGTVEGGWTVHDDSSKDLTERIQEAIKADTGEDGKDRSRFFQLSTGGAYQVTLENLPGDVKTYYWYANQDSQLKEKLNETVRYTANYFVIDPDTYDFTPIDTSEFDREFAAHIYIPNVKNYLVVEKEDNKGNAMNGVTFSLFEADKVSKYIADGKVKLEELQAAMKEGTVTAFDTAVTENHKEYTGAGSLIGNGIALFPNQNQILPEGTYYLIETDVGENTDYNLNPTAVKVIVDSTGVYADAGTSDDGVSTYRVVGSVLKSMLRFASDDGIDASLNHIKVQFLTAAEYSGIDTGWSEWDDDAYPSGEQHLQYNPDRKTDSRGMEYSPPQKVGGGDDVTLTAHTETGWNKLAVRQCLDHYKDGQRPIYTDEEKSLVQDLGTRDISGLFSSIQYVTVQNKLKDEVGQPTETTGNLTVSKTVSGSRGDTEKAFTFTVTLGNRDFDGQCGQMYFQNGVATFTLKHGEEKTASRLPAGSSYTVAESGHSGYTVTASGETGTIQAGDTVTAAFHNYRGGGGNKPSLNTEDHYGYIIGYPVDYYTGLPTEDQTKKPVKPQGNITRAEVATIYFRMLTDESRNHIWCQDSGYPDVALADWFNNAIATLSNGGIISGYPDGTFDPNGYITRAEFAVIAARFFDMDYQGEDLFPDIDGHWAQDYINQAAENGFIEGYPDGTFGPDKYITRAEAVTLVNRTLDRHPDPDHFLEGMLVWPDNLDTEQWYYADMQEATNSHEYQVKKDAQGNEYEVWTKVLPVRDWEAFEKEWSDANSAENPGEVVGKN